MEMDTQTMQQITRLLAIITGYLIWYALVIVCLCIVIPGELLRKAWNLFRKPACALLIIAMASCASIEGCRTQRGYGPAVVYRVDCQPIIPQPNR